jgi:photosystem II oxygen-evolving enhancer protein 1
MRFRPLLALVLALCLTLVTACSGGAKALDRSSITYDDIVNTGKANDCPSLPDSARGTISLDPDSRYQLREICLHPSEVFVKGEPANKRQEAQFVATKILTRYTSSLDQVYGDLKLDGDQLTFTELGGIDFQPVTVLLPGGEEVPFTFSSKELVATSSGNSLTTSSDFSGDYRAPSDDEKLRKETIKQYVDGTGNMNFSITKIDAATGEFAGVFTAIQPSDTDMGTKNAVDVKITGELYGRLEKV